MNFQDWNEVKWDKRGEKSKNESNKDFMSKQLRTNNVVSSVKPGGLNQNKININPNLKKIEKEEDTFKIKTVSMNVSKKIAKARCDKKMTQKELANAIYLPFKLIQDYENGTAIPNHVVLNKIEKILETRVRD
jgi:putative transcription factor